MDLTPYRFNGFKLYEREVITTDSDVSGIKKHFVVVQFKNGKKFKLWRAVGGSFEECEDWKVRKSFLILDVYDRFIKNLTEEEVFGILL